MRSNTTDDPTTRALTTGSPPPEPELARLLTPSESLLASKLLVLKDTTNLAILFASGLAHNPYPRATSECLAILLARDAVSPKIEEICLFTPYGNCHIRPELFCALFGAIRSAFAARKLPKPEFPTEAPIYRNLPVRSAAARAARLPLCPRPSDSPEDELKLKTRIAASIARDEYLETLLLQPLPETQLSAVRSFNDNHSAGRIPNAWPHILQTLSDLCHTNSPAGALCAAWLSSIPHDSVRDCARPALLAARNSQEIRAIAHAASSAPPCANTEQIRL